MTITEQFICGKHTAADCEDGIVITPHFAAVIDGSTSKTPLRLDASMKNGRFAMLLICDYIRQMAADSTMDHFCQGITHRIAEEYAGRGIAERMAEHPEERLTASAIVYSERRKEVWMVGDCQAIIDGKYYDNSKPYEHEIAMQRATLIKNGMAPASSRLLIPWCSPPTATPPCSLHCVRARRLLPSISPQTRRTSRTSLPPRD